MSEFLIFVLLSLLLVDLVVYVLYPVAIHLMGSRNISEHVTYSRVEVDSIASIYHLIPLYNEADVIDEKIRNCLEMTASLSLVHVFVIDESNDGTVDIVNSYTERFPDRMVCINKGYRKGKNDSLNVAVERVKPNGHDLLFFSDANTMFDSNVLDPMISMIGQGYGLVGGSMCYLDEESGVAKSEGLYWKYEEWIRRNEARLLRCVVVNGGNFLMKAEHFEKVPHFVPNDLEAPLRLCGAGIPVGFCPESKGYETAVNEGSEEYSRKTRMANRQMNCIRYLWKRVDAKTKMQIIIRKVLRWSGYHIFVLACLLSISLAFLENSYLFDVMGVMSAVLLIVFMLLSLSNNLNLSQVVNTPLFHFVMVHRSSFKGMLSSFFGKRVGVWDKATSNRKKAA